MARNLSVFHSLTNTHINTQKNGHSYLGCQIKSFFNLINKCNYNFIDIIIFFIKSRKYQNYYILTGLYLGYNNNNGRYVFILLTLLGI